MYFYTLTLLSVGTINGFFTGPPHAIYQQNVTLATYYYDICATYQQNNKLPLTTATYAPHYQQCNTLATYYCNMCAPYHQQNTLATYYYLVFRHTNISFHIWFDFNIPHRQVLLSVTYISLQILSLHHRISNKGLNVRADLNCTKKIHNMYPKTTKLVDN